MRPQLSVCFAAPCSLANHRPHNRAQGVAPQASQLRNGITSAEGMVSSKVQIWQLTVWGKGFERQASAMVSVVSRWRFLGSWTRCDRVALVRGRRLLGAFIYARSGFGTVRKRSRPSGGARYSRGP